jgi:hypothetical protein
MLVKDF